MRFFGLLRSTRWCSRLFLAALLRELGWNACFPEADAGKPGRVGGAGLGKRLLCRRISIADPAEQLRVVAAAEFTKQTLLNKQEARVLYAAERAVAETGLKWRVMAQVSLGEILRSENARAFAAINSKRVDLLVISQSGEPLAAIEYQGSGHYQNTAAIRDAVKKEALRKAGVRYIEVMGRHTADDVRREIGRLAFAETKRLSPV